MITGYTPGDSRPRGRIADGNFGPLASVEAEPSAYEAGQVIGEILMAALAIAVVVVILRWIRGH